MPIEHKSYPFDAKTADSVGSRIDIGADEREVEIPRVDAALAESLCVDPANPWYSTDGFCLFTKDGNILLRCLTRSETYVVPTTCSAIGDEAFAYNTVIRRIVLHEGVVSIGDRAFVCTTLDTIRTPSSLRVIGDAAFAEGKNLRHVDLSEGLERIGAEAFSDCAKLENLVVPASVTQIGPGAFARCGAQAHGRNCGLRIDAGNKRYFIDDAGVLYRRDDGSLELVEALDPIVGGYEAIPGTAEVCERAFAFQRGLSGVSFPPSTLSIGKRAFLECERLTHVRLPQNLRSIGAEAFYHTALTEISLPASLTELGPASLVVNISIASQSAQTGVGGRGVTDFYQTTLSGRLHEVSVPRFDVKVSPDNPRYILEEGFLCERDEATGSLRAVQFVSGGTDVTVPANVKSIAEYAMFGVGNVRTLRLHTGIENIGHSALALSYPLDLIEVNDGRTPPIRLYPAPNSSGTMAQRKAFRAGWLDIDQLVRDCDSSLSFMMPCHERTSRMLARLANGRCLSQQHEHEFAMTVRMCADELIRQFARSENRRGITDMLDLGFIDGNTIAHAVEVANAAQGVACVRMLLEEKRSRFEGQALDFSL